MSSRVRLLLGLAAILAAMRFVVVPWTEAQAGMHDRLYAITRQLDRAAAIVEAGSELQARRDALAAIVRTLAERAPLANPGSEHRVQVQRELRAAVESVGLKAECLRMGPGRRNRGRRAGFRPCAAAAGGAAPQRGRSTCRHRGRLTACVRPQPDRECPPWRVVVQRRERDHGAGSVLPARGGCVTPRMQVIVVAAILALAGAVDFVQRIHMPRSTAIRGAGMEATTLPDLPLSLASARQRLHELAPGADVRAAGSVDRGGK